LQANWYLYAAERDEKDKDPKIEAELLGKAKTSYLKVGPLSLIGPLTTLP
jgi:hypothetical protein